MRHFQLGAIQKAITVSWHDGSQVQPIATDHKAPLLSERAHRRLPNLRINTLLPSTAQYIQLALGKGQVTEHSQRRNLGIVRGILTGLAGRGVAVIVSFFSVPLTLRYLGAERYGAWVTISTAMAWIVLADFGLSSSLTNAVSEGYAVDNHDLAGDYVAAAFWSLVAVAAFLSIPFFSLWRIV